MYIHNSTITGKVKSVDVFKQTFTLQGPKGQHAVQADSYTVFKLNGIAGSIKDVAVGTGVKVKGAWQRTPSQIQARQVDIKIRLVNIEITGQLVGKNEHMLTVVSNNLMYAVDASKAEVRDKTGKPTTIPTLTLASHIKIKGKHIAESQDIVASYIKELRT